jgi:hypothetical protein
MDDNYDTDAAGILIGDDDCDVATALAASIKESTDQPARLNTAGVIAALIAMLVMAWLLLS